MFWLEKLFGSNKPVENIGQKSYFDDDMGTFAIWNNKYWNKDVISKLSQAELINLYTGWIYACVNLRSDAFASLEGNLYRSKNDLTAVVENAMVDLIDWELKKAVFSILDLFGTCYLLKNTIGSRIESFSILRTDSVRPRQTPEGEIVGYTFHSWSRTYDFSPNQILVIHTFNPAEQYPNATTWVSPAMWVAKQQLMDMMSVEYNYLFFKEGGKPGTILTTDKKVDEDIKKRIIDKWNTFFAWLRNSHKTAVLDQWLKYQSTTIGQKDMELVKQREFTRDEILAMFWVSLPLLWDSANMSYADKQVPEYYFQKYHLLPRCRQIENAFNKQLFKLFGYYTFWNIVSKDLIELWNVFDRGAMTINEYRTVHNLPLVKDGDVNNEGNALLIEKPKAKNIFSESDKKVIGSSMMKVLWNLKKKASDEVAEKLWLAMAKRADEYEADMKKEISSIWDDQQALIISNIKGSKSVKDFIKKAEEDEDEIFNGFVLWVAWLAGKMTGILKRAVKKEWDEAYKLTGAVGSFDESKLDNWIKTDVTKFGKQIDKTTKETILRKVSEGYEAGKSEKEIINDIKNQFSGFKKSRLQQIVRSESTRAVGRANMEAYKQAGIERKEWYTNIDARTCPHCAEMNGKIIKTGDAFFNKWDTTTTGLELSYDSVLHPPLHVLCRCLLLPA